MSDTYRAYNAWLQVYPRPAPYAFCVEAEKSVSETAKNELSEGLSRLYGNGAASTAPRMTLRLSYDSALPAQGYAIRGGENTVLLRGADTSGLLYGVFAFLRALAPGADPAHIDEQSAPRCARRCLNHWDNLDGTIERGYAGRSLFFEGGKFDYDPQRLRDYARLLCSIGINEIALNNVNVTPEAARLCTEEVLPELAAVADIFRPYGVRLVLTVEFAAPIQLGGLPVADPLDKDVIRWWADCAARVYKHIPDLAGFLVKADSEFRTGPASLGRTQADGANTLARALKPFGGVVYWRCFVYNCRQDWRDTVTDRPMAAYREFAPLDGQFDENVLLQIKNGPVDFQVREPISPLFGALKRTPRALELQVTQEYTGQQIDMFNLAVMWQEIFASFTDDTHRLSDLMGREIPAHTAVANVGRDENWTGHTLSQLNLYAFGRLGWDPTLTAADLTEEWLCQSFPAPEAPLAEMKDMLMQSADTYEKYSAPLGIGWMINPSNHYGPNVDGYEFMQWGTYHRANHEALGVDRTEKGTGLTAQYHPAIGSLFADVTRCPEELLLFFHRLRYDHRLKNGKTVLQHIYDTHFEGAAEAEGFLTLWESLESRLPAEAFQSVRNRLKRQLANAIEWRDIVNTYFYRKSGVPDEKGRKIYS